MGLQFVFGGSGAGKSTKVYDKIWKQSMEHPEKKYLIMVPDQFTMYTQKQLCLMHPRGGIMNIEVLSFSRLIHRVSEEVGRKERAVLDDTGKNLVLRKVAIEKEEELVLLKEKVKRPGYIHEVKSMISEFYQYDIREKDMEEMIAQAQGKGALSLKMQDLKTLYGGFAQYIRDKYITTEESLDELCGMIPRSGLLRGSVIVFDGFTGFTPVQNRVLRKLMQVADEVIVTLCADGEDDIVHSCEEQKLFALSGKTYRTLSGLAQEHGVAVRNPIYLTEKPVKRYENNPAMAFLEANLFRYKNKIYEDEQQAIFIREADGLVSEIQSVCLEIKNLICREEYCYRDIAVVTGDLERYAHLLETEFARYKIPYFIDRNRGVAHHPLTEYLKSALGLLKDNFSYESVFRFLRSGMTGLLTDETDRLENYVRAYGIRGKKAYLEEFTLSDCAEELNVIRMRLVEEIQPLLSTCANAKEYAMALFELCHANCLQEKCNAYAAQFEERGDASKAKEYEKIYPACMDLLNQIYELIGEDEMDVAEFLAVFEAGVAEIRVGTIPQNVDQVVVGDIERTRLKQIRALFFIGVNDGVIPGGNGNGGLLSDMERQFFIEQGRELAPSPRQKIFEQRLYLYQNMTKPSDRLYLSYSKVDGSGKSVLPSYLIRVIQGLYPLLKVEPVTDKIAGNLAKIATREDGLDDFAQLLRMYLNGESASGSGEEMLRESLGILCRVYGEDEVAGKIREAALTTYENVPLSDMAAELLYRDRNKGSVSRLEQFAACAYAHFLRYGLELREQEEYDFDAMDFGIIYHHVLEKVSFGLRQHGVTLAEAEQSLIHELVERALEEYASEYGGRILSSNARNEHRVGQMKKVLLQSLSAMQYQLSKGTFKPTYFEKSFQLKGDFPLIGKVDRIDLCREDDKVYVKVVDYKSGTKKFSLEELYYGLSLQLPAYMNAAMEMLKEKEPEAEAVPASMLYCRLQNPFVDESVRDVEQELRKEMRPEGLSNDSDKVISMLDEGLSGSSDVIRITKNKDGSLGRYSQTVSEEVFRTVLAYTEQKMHMLMEEMRRGEIGAVPVHLEKDKNDSCTYCAYRGICRMDMRIPGYEKRELPKMTEEKIEEEMRNEIHAETAGSHNDEK
ncbi:MAG: helicase-exonuclease AddAB subunit AddB [Lachnospiraceae bacterium]|nr:helicase-exonuclease AddAB subunit AddB [Lachnospiraceae bacterium]